MARIVVIGAGVGGLGAALGLADRGHDVLVVERDPPPPTTRGDDAFEEWDRPHVPQFRQAHAFSARSRNLLATVRARRARSPPRRRHRGDQLLQAARTARTAPPRGRRVHRPPVAPSGVRAGAPPDGGGAPTRRDPLPGGRHRPPPPRRLPTACESSASGSTTIVDEPADVVIDAGGRRSPTLRWLNDLGVDVGEDVQDCGVTYHTRYYRQTEHVDAVADHAPRRARPARLGARAGLRRRPPHVRADDRRTAVGRGAQGAPAQLGVRRRPRRGPECRAVGGARQRDTRSTTSPRWRAIRTSCRHWVCDGEPVVLGVLPVGDSLCTTNPAYGWGASMALTYAFAAVDAISDGGDQRAIALRYHDAVCDEADGVYRESAAMDRTRGYRWRCEPVPERRRSPRPSASR